MDLLLHEVVLNFQVQVVNHFPKYLLILLEPGDCFLIYPDLKDAENPVSKSSVRLEKMAQGIRDVNKIKQMVIIQNIY